MGECGLGHWGERKVGSGIRKSRGGVGVRSKQWMSGVGVEGDGRIILQGEVPGAWLGPENGWAVK